MTKKLEIQPKLNVSISFHTIVPMYNHATLTINEL